MPFKILLLTYFLWLSWFLSWYEW